MLSILRVRLTIKVKVGIPESFKIGWYTPPPKKKKKKLGRVTLMKVLFCSNVCANRLSRMGGMSKFLIFLF